MFDQTTVFLYCIQSTMIGLHVHIPCPERCLSQKQHKKLVKRWKLNSGNLVPSNNVRESWHSTFWTTWPNGPFKVLSRHISVDSGTKLAERALNGIFFCTIVPEMMPYDWCDLDVLMSSNTVRKCVNDLWNILAWLYSPWGIVLSENRISACPVTLKSSLMSLARLCKKSTIYDH